LEEYKVLCEKLILKLLPECFLPITEDHLENIPKPPSEPFMNELRRTLAQKERELNKARILNDADPQRRIPPESQMIIEKLEHDKKALEDSLKAEILHSEEQRNYIQILKELLESNTDFSFILERARNTKEPFDLLVELINVKKDRDYYKADIAKYESLMLEEKAKSDKYYSRLTEIEKDNEEISKKMAGMETYLENTVKALEEARESNAKLEEEKNTVLDYVEELTAKYDQLNIDMESLNVLQQKIAEEKMNSDKVIEELNKQIKDNEVNFHAEFMKNSKKLESYKKQLERYGEEIRKMKEKCEEKVNAVVNVLETLNLNKELGETQEKVLKNALDELQDIRNNSQAQIIKTKEELELTMTGKIREIEESVKEENKKLIEDIKRITEEKNTLSRNKEQLQENCAALNITLNDIQNELEQTKKELNKLHKEKKEAETMKKKTSSRYEFGMDEPQNETFNQVLNTLIMNRDMRIRVIQ
jgi:chromosome segregation ATPase